MTSVNTLAESTDFSSISLPEQLDSVPVIDYSSLTSGNPDERSKTLHNLAKACEEWGFFMVVNHDVPQCLTKSVLNASAEFFNLTEEEKKECSKEGIFTPFYYGSGTKYDEHGKIFYGRDHIRAGALPQFNIPKQIAGLSESVVEYCKRNRMVAVELLKGISETLGLEEADMKKELNLDSGFQAFVVNYYRPCPQSEQATGMPPHSDPTLLTLLYENEVGGLKVLHKGKWVHIDAIPNALLVGVGDELEIYSNGKYKSNIHYATLNDKSTRMSMLFTFSPSLDAVVAPASKLVGADNQAPAYVPIGFKEYMDLLPKYEVGDPTRSRMIDQVRVQVQ